MSQRKARRRAAHSGQLAERRRLLIEQLEANGLNARAIDDVLPEILAQVYRPLPTDPDEQRRLASLCLVCGEAGHRAANCPTVVCFACGGSGHRQKHCPAKQ